MQQLYTIINDATRTTDAADWRSKLDATLDTKTFLKYLAINTTIQNWDTYGRMTHNYFLYNNPANGLLTWIPWDNNEALQTGKQSGSLNLNFSGLNASQWSIIRYMYQDAVYKSQYDTYLKETVSGAFNPTSIQALYTSRIDRALRHHRKARLHLFKKFIRVCVGDKYVRKSRSQQSSCG
jgi:spore coat protein H